MKTSPPRRWGLALALVICVGLAFVAGLWSSTAGVSARIGKLWDRRNTSPPPPTAAVALKKGLAGFDFTRVGHTGVALSRQDATWKNVGNEAEGTKWDCLRDNVSGLWWEAKTHEDANGTKELRHMDHTYGWTGAEVYVDAVNTAGLCGFKDWRLPSVAELKPLTSINKGGATIDLEQFPNTAPTGYWTASAYPHRDNYVWYVYFAGAGNAFGDAPTANYAIRLVRNGQ